MITDKAHGGMSDEKKGARETPEMKDHIPWVHFNPEDVVIVDDPTAGDHGPSHTYVGVEPDSIGPGPSSVTPPRPGPPGP